MTESEYPSSQNAQQSQYATSEQYPSQTYQTANVYGQYAAQPAAAASAPAKQGGLAKTFFAGFFGALLACVLAFGGLMMFGNKIFEVVGTAPSSGSEQQVTIGAQSAATITAADTDITLPEAVAAKAVPSVVCIYVYTTQSAYSYYGISFGDGGGELMESSLGSGIILTEDGYILTNYHVIEGSEALKVNISGDEYDAYVVGTDESSDLAVIKVDGATGLVPAELGDSDNLTVGEWVMTIGAPFGLEQSVATGVVSATSRSQVMEDYSYDYYYGYGSSSQPSLTLYPNLIQTDAAINPGNSGGALVDSEGKVIGINTLITSYSGNYSGVGFAIPINYASGIAQQIIEGKTPTHAKLGVSLTTVNSSNAKRYGLPVSEGAYINSVEIGSGADEAGLQSEDIIVALGGHKVTSSTEVTLYIRENNPGDTIDVVVNRNGEEITLQVTLGSDEEQLQAASAMGEEPSSGGSGAFGYGGNSDGNGGYGGNEGGSPFGFRR